VSEKILKVQGIFSQIMPCFSATDRFEFESTSPEGAILNVPPLKRSVSSHQTSSIQVKTKKCGKGLATMGDHNFRPRPLHYHPHIQGGPQEQAFP